MVLFDVSLPRRKQDDNATAESSAITAIRRSCQLFRMREARLRVLRWANERFNAPVEIAGDTPTAAQAAVADPMLSVDGLLSFFEPTLTRHEAHDAPQPIEREEPGEIGELFDEPIHRCKTELRVVARKETPAPAPFALEDLHDLYDEAPVSPHRAELEAAIADLYEQPAAQYHAEEVDEPMGDLYGAAPIQQHVELDAAAMLFEEPVEEPIEETGSRDPARGRVRGSVSRYARRRPRERAPEPHPAAPGRQRVGLDSAQPAQAGALVRHAHPSTRRLTSPLSAPAPPASRRPSSPGASTRRARSCCSTARSARARKSSSAAARAATSPTPSSPSAISGAAVRRSSAACCARFRSPTRSRSFAKSALRCTRKRTASSFPTRTARATCSTRCCAKRDRAGVTLGARPSRPRRQPIERTTSRVVTSAGELRADAVVLATGGHRCRRAAATAPATRWRSGSATRSFRPPRRSRRSSCPSRRFTRSCPACPRTSSSRSGPTARSLVRLAGALLWTHFGVSGPVAMNASRHWLRAQLEGRRGGDHASTSVPAGSSRASTPTWQRVAAAQSEDDAAHRCRSDAAGVGCRRDAAPAGDRRRASRSRTSRETIGGGCRARWSNGRCRSSTRAATPSPRRRPAASTLDEIDPATMASRVCPGLYLVGEILDVDGRIGGFNFQWAWSSAFVAARVRLREEPPRHGDPVPADSRLPLTPYVDTTYAVGR